MKIRSLSIILFAFSLLQLLACNNENKQSVTSFLNKAQQDTLMVQIITYIDYRPEGVGQNEKFDPKFRPAFVNRLPVFHFHKYYINKDSIHYFLVTWPARSSKPNQRRATGGKFKLNGAHIIDFEEIFVTPRSEEKDVQRMGQKLFNEMIETGNVNRYVGEKELIEWPNEQSQYDKTTHQWVYRLKNE